MLVNYNYDESFVMFASVTFNAANNIFDAHLNYIFPEIPRVYATL